MGLLHPDVDHSVRIDVLEEQMEILGESISGTGSFSPLGCSDGSSFLVVSGVGLAVGVTHDLVVAAAIRASGARPPLAVTHRVTGRRAWPVFGRAGRDNSRRSPRSNRARSVVRDSAAFSWPR